jgi:hypothetical protein
VRWKTKKKKMVASNHLPVRKRLKEMKIVKSKMIKTTVCSEIFLSDVLFCVDILKERKRKVNDPR